MSTDVSTDDKSPEGRGKRLRNPQTRKRKWKKKVACLLLFVLLLYPLSLLIINTSWAKSKLTHKLEAKTGFEWQLGTVMWVPFGNIQLNDLQTLPANKEADEGGVSVELISISPIWGKLISGDLVWNEIRIDGVNLDVERSLLESMLRNAPESTLPAMQDVEPLPAAKPKLANPAKPAPKVVKPRPITPKKPVLEKEKIAERAFIPEQTMVITGLNIKVRDKDKTWFQCDDISMNIPYAGKSREGSIRIVDESGKEESIPVSWDEKNVVIDKTGIELFGLKVDLKSRFNTAARSKIFAYQFLIVDQPYHYELHRPNFHVKLNADHVQGRFIMRGNLLSPQTWNGIGGIQFSQFSIQETQKTMKKLEFDEVYAKGRMLQGNFLLDDAAAQSEELSFRANGVVRKDTYAYGVVRCVANNEYSEKLGRIYHGSRVIKLDRSPYHFLEPLQTPDRKYCDIYFDGKLTNMDIKHNRSKTWQSFNQVMKNLKRYKDNELKEDGLYIEKRVDSYLKKSTSGIQIEGDVD